MSITPNGQAPMQSRQPLQTSDWMNDGVELRADDGAGRADLEAARAHASACRRRTSSTSARRDGPAPNCSMNFTCASECRRAGACCRRVARQRGAPAVGGRQLIPLRARELARLAPDTHRRVGIEAHGLGHSGLSTLQTKALPSWIRHVRVADERGQLVDESPRHQTLVAPVPRMPDVVHDAPRRW